MHSFGHFALENEDETEGGGEGGEGEGGNITGGLEQDQQQLLNNRRSSNSHSHNSMYAPEHDIPKQTDQGPAPQVYGAPIENGPGFEELDDDEKNEQDLNHGVRVNNVSINMNVPELPQEQNENDLPPQTPIVNEESKEEVEIEKETPQNEQNEQNQNNNNNNYQEIQNNQQEEKEQLVEDKELNVVEDIDLPPENVETTSENN